MKKQDLNKLLDPFAPKEEQVPFYMMGTGAQQASLPSPSPSPSSPQKEEITVDKVLEDKIKSKPLEQRLPLAQVMPKIEQEVAQIDAKTENKPDLRRKLYEDLINKYGMDKREELLAKFEEQNKGFNWLAFAAGLGSTLQGKGGQGAIDLVRLQREGQQFKLNEFDKTKAGLEKDLERLDTQAQLEEMRDPNSLLSRQLQKSISTLLPGRDFSKFNAEQLTKVFPFLQAEAKVISEREAQAKTEREKQQEIVRMLRGGDPLRSKIFELAANEKERDKAFEEADFVKTSQQTINNLTELFNKAQRGEIDMGTFSKLANTTLSEYRRIASESGVPQKSIGYVEKVWDNLFKRQRTFAKEDLETAVNGIVLLTKNNTKTLNGLGIDYNLELPFAKVEKPAPKHISDLPDQGTIRPGQVVIGADGKQYKVKNNVGDLDPVEQTSSRQQPDAPSNEPTPKNLADLPKQDRPVRPGQTVVAPDGRKYKVVNTRGDLEPI
jgi:hypothetical protein